MFDALPALLGSIAATAPASGELLAATSAGAEGGGSAIVSAIAIASISLGILFFLGAVVGLVRFPDFYTRMHAAGKGDTLSSLMVVFGFALYHLDQGGWDMAHALVGLKLLAICAFIMVTSPTSTHALMNAGYEDRCVPSVGEGGNALDGGGVTLGTGSDAEKPTETDNPPQAT